MAVTASSDHSGTLLHRRSPVEDYRHVYHGTVLASKVAGEWPGLSAHLYRLAPMEGAFPPLADVEIRMLVRGPAKIIWIGEGFAQERDMKVGDITIVPPLLADWWTWNESPTMVCVSIHSDILASYLENELDTDPARVTLKRRFAIEDKPLREFCFALIQEMRDPRPGSNLYVADLTFRTIGHLLSKHASIVGQHEPLGKTRATHCVDRVAEYIQANLAEEHSLDALAAVAEMTPQRLSRTFKAQMNMTPYEFVMTERLTSALVRLRGTKTSSAAIAAEAGFGSVRHLANAVAEVTGASLHEIRGD